MSNPIAALFVAQYAMDDKQGRMWRVRDRHSEQARVPRGSVSSGEGRRQRSAGSDQKDEGFRLRPRHA